MPSDSADRNRRSTRPGWSIFTRQLALYLLIILLISGVIGLFFSTTAREHLEQEIGTKLQDIARISARNAPLERLELIRVGDDQSRMVLRLKEKLGEIREATGIQNISVFRPDLVSLLDLDPTVPIGSRYELPHLGKDLLRRLEAGVSVNTGGYGGEREEILLSAYAPVRRPDGRLFAVVAVDAGAGELAVIERLQVRLYLITFVAMALAALLALFFARSIARPIRHIARTAEQLGRGDYAARAPVLSGDEVGLLAESVNRMAEQVRQRDAALKEMAASVAHEIRNPLNSIKLLVSLLADELADLQPARSDATAPAAAPAGPCTGSIVATLHYEIGKLNRFIDEFLTYARPVTLIRDRVPAASLVAGVLDMAAAEAGERGVELGADRAGDETELSVDRLRLEQTLLNIVMNAVQSCGEGGRVVLRIDPAPAGGGLDFVVEDSGPGIAADALPRIFEAFFTTRVDGTGLGLANASKIVEEHQGHISAENTPDSGARFTLHLPPERLIVGEL